MLPSFVMPFWSFHLLASTGVYEERLCCTVPETCAFYGLVMQLKGTVLLERLSCCKQPRTGACQAGLRRVANLDMFLVNFWKLFHTGNLLSARSTIVRDELDWSKLTTLHLKNISLFGPLWFRYGGSLPKLQNLWLQNTPVFLRKKPVSLVSRYVKIMLHGWVRADIYTELVAQ